MSKKTKARKSMATPEPSAKVILYKRDLDRDSVSVVIQFVRHDGTEGLEIVPRDVLLNASKLRKLLGAKGVNFTPDDLKALSAAHEIDTAMTVYTMSDTGWRSSGSYGWPGRPIIENGHEINFRDIQDGEFLASFEARAGTLDGWKQEVCVTLGCSSFGILALGVVLAGPLVQLSGVSEGAMWAFSGNSGVGKTGICMAAQSAMGTSERHLMASWDVTRAGFQGLVAYVRDFTLIMDDTSRDGLPQGERVRLWHDVAHALAGGGKRLVAHAYEAQHAPARIRLPGFGLTSGEVSPDDQAALTGGAVQGGARVRFIDIPVPLPENGGVFDTLVKGIEPEAIVDTAHDAAKQLEHTVKEHHGVAFPVFLDFLTSIRTDLPKRLKKHGVKFVSALERRRKAPLTSSQLRVAEKFSIVRSALKFAMEAGVVPFSKAQVDAAINVCFDAAASDQDKAALRVEGQVKALRRVLRDRTLVPRVAAGEATPAASMGFRRKMRGKKVACMRGDKIAAALEIDNQAVLELMDEAARRKILEPGSKGYRTRSVKVAGKTTRYYVFSPAFVAPKPKVTKAKVTKAKVTKAKMTKAKMTKPTPKPTRRRSPTPQRRSPRR